MGVIKKAHKQKLVTVIGVNYIEQIVPGLLEKSLEVYGKRDFSKKHFQSSVSENTNSTAAIVLSVLGIEAYRNRIYYLEKKRVNHVPADLSSVFITKDKKFSGKDFEAILSEIFVIRDVIVHNHIYEVEWVSDENWDMVSHKQRMLEGYGDDRKYQMFVNKRARRTINLGLNVQPGKIGFEDLFKVLVIFDLFVGISTKLFQNNYVPFRFARELNGQWEDSFSRYLAYIYNQIPNPKYKASLKKLLYSLKGTFRSFLPDSWDVFLNNFCFKCQEFGFYQPNHITKCLNCGFEVTTIKHI